MNRKSVLAVFLSVSSLCAATPTITGVTARQRKPWNGKVDISFTVTGDVTEQGPATLSVSAADRENGTTYAATSSALSGNTGAAVGTHHVVWDLDAQGLAFKSDDVVFTVAYVEKPKPYCVIDLSAGSSASSYPVTYLAEPPSGGFNTDEYKTTKLVLRLIEPGTFMMCGSYETTLTKPFYCGVFEVTQRQYELVTGGNPSSYKGDKRPVERVSWNTIRGDSGTYNWPGSANVDPNSFIGKLRGRTGLDFDLPTEAQWEYACRAGTTTTYSYGDSANGAYMWYKDNSSSQTHEVGTKLPNAWGLYDMHGNALEWCLDWDGGLSSPQTDPLCSSSGSRRVLRGGGWFNGAVFCASSGRSRYDPSDGNNYYSLGFRLVRTLSD